MNAAVSALRFFFKVTLARPGFRERLAEVLSPQEVALLHYLSPVIGHIGNIFHQQREGLERPNVQKAF